MRTIDETLQAAKFWRDLVDLHWERQPAVLRAPLRAPLITASEVFDTFVLAADALRAGRRDVPLRLYIENTRLGQDLAAHFPSSADGSLERYVERLDKRLGGRRFMFVLNNFQAYNAEVWGRLRELFGGLFELVGVPAGTADADAFIGNYERTAAGIHKDPASNFTFPVLGRKRMLVWPFEFFRDRGVPDSAERTYFQLDGLDYHAFRDSATILEGGPGDLYYWPSTSWHIGEGVDPLHVSLNVSLFFPWEPAKLVLGALARVVERRLGAARWASMYPFDPTRIADMARELPAALEEALAVVQESARDPGLEHELSAAWMNRVTGFGFQDTPGLATHRHLGDASMIQCDPRYPIVWANGEPCQVVCSASGGSFTIPAHPGALELLAELNRGRPLRVGELTARFSGSCQVDGEDFDLSQADLRALLERLLRARAIEVTS